MVPHPDMTTYLVREHQGKLLREAEAERMAATVRSKEPRLSVRGPRGLVAPLLAALRAVRSRPSRELAPTDR